MPDVEDPPIETTPLVGRDNDDDEPLKDMKAHSIKEKIVGGAALVGLTTSVAAMAIESNPAVYVSGAIGSVVAPLAAMQESKLTQVEALKQTNGRISEEVAQLQQENVRLQTQVSSLEESVDHLEGLSETLESIRAVEGQSLDELEKQLVENEKIYKKMKGTKLNCMLANVIDDNLPATQFKENLRGDILQSIISVAMAVDSDGDMCLSDDEINTLIIEIEKLVDNRVDFNDDLLRRKLVENGRSLTAVMDIIGDLMNDDMPKSESIFAFINKDEGKEDLAAMVQAK